MSAAWLVRADGFVGDVADTAFYAVVDADLTNRTEGFVVKSGDAERSEEFFVELAQIFEVRCERGQLETLVGQQKLLIAGIPKASEAALKHDRRDDGHLVHVVRAFAKFGAAAVFFHADNAACAANGKAERCKFFHLLRCELLFDVPHGALSLVNAGSSVKWTGIRVVGEFPITAASSNGRRNLCNNFRVAYHPPGFIVSVQVEQKQFIGNGHLINSPHFSKSATGKTDVSFDI